MKKQLLIAAVAASMTSVAMADISITGSTKANVLDGAPSIEADLKITGKSGDSSLVANIALDSGVDTGNQAGDMVEDLYVTTSLMGVNAKAGAYRSGKSELDQTSAAPSARYNLSTTVSGVTATYEATKDTHDLTLGGTVAGVSIKHKMKQNDDTETWVSGSFGGVNLSWNQEHTDSGDKDDTAISIDTTMNGVTAKYVKIDSDTGTVSDGYVGKFDLDANEDASAFGLSTAVAGNTVTLKKIEIADADSNKIIINRPLGNGATFEATYTDKDAADDTLDLELAVKF